MGSVNKVILVGNLGRDAELRYTPGGAPVATLNLATTEVWNDKGGQKQEKTEWHRVVLWGKSAESPQRVPGQGQADLRRGPAADAPVGRQGRQQALHDRDPRRPGRAARQCGRRRREAGSRPASAASASRRADGRRARLGADGRRYSVLAGCNALSRCRAVSDRPATDVAQGSSCSSRRFSRSSACCASTRVGGTRILLDDRLERLPRVVRLLERLVRQPELVVGGRHAVALRVVGDHLLQRGDRFRVLAGVVERVADVELRFVGLRRRRERADERLEPIDREIELAGRCSRRTTGRTCASARCSSAGARRSARRAAPGAAGSPAARIVRERGVPLTATASTPRSVAAPAAPASSSTAARWCRPPSRAARARCRRSR